MARLIVTNGDSAAQNIRDAGVKGRVLEWRDMLHEGPVPAARSLDLVSDVRADYIATSLGFDLGTVRADFAQRDGVLAAHIVYGEVELWFEHDLFDQLQLIQLLAYFADAPERLGLRLMQADTYLGALAPAEIGRFDGTAAPVTTLQLEAGRAAWDAFTAPTPEQMARLCAAALPELPYLGAALRRLLSELPAPGSGLSLIEERTLRLLEGGPRSVGHLFGLVSEMEEARFMGDLSFFQRLDALAAGPEPLITGLPFGVAEVRPFTPGQKPDAGEKTYRDYARAEIRITPAGLAALQGTFDHAARNGIDRWMGGTHLTPDTLWRYAREEGRLVAPA
ncbi:MAG: hypothetical protein AB1592_06050 [Pseudomonadota bacterium]